jgi:hypothetical protein
MKMNVYAIWVDLIDSSQDLDFFRAVQQFMNHFQERGLVDGFTIERRKFGFSPDGLGEFHIRIHTNTLDALDQAFNLASTRTGETEIIHKDVFSRVKNFKSALYRTFPDPGRTNR